MFRQLIAILAILLLVSSSAIAKDNFFGVKILDSKKILTAITNIRVNPQGGILYTIQKEYADDSIYGFATISRDVDFTITNKSKSPLKMNYFADKFELMTNDETFFELEKSQNKVSDYPSILNPGESASVSLTGYRGKAQDVRYLWVTIALSQTNILFSRINHADPDSSKQEK